MSEINLEEEHDFPLVEILLKERPLGKRTYQPINDPRLAGWEVGRKDSPERLKYILEHLEGKTVLDIGCAEGYFSREIAKQGFEVTAIDFRPNIIEVAKYLSISEGVNVQYHTGRWKDIIGELSFFDNILHLSVLHNDIKGLGIEKALVGLQALRNKATRVFLETPRGIRERHTPDFLDFGTEES
ncbi:unnamed protein product, partial [marine sediment metagenome]